jgi:hypothetical protein
MKVANWHLATASDCWQLFHDGLLEAEVTLILDFPHWINLLPSKTFPAWIGIAVDFRSHFGCAGNQWDRNELSS